MDLKDLTHEHFTRRLNEKFRVGSGAATLELELLEATLWGTGDQKTRAPFSLIFRGPRETVLPQRIYVLEGQAGGPLEIFLVPVGPDPQRTGLLYQAIFT